MRKYGVLIASWLCLLAIAFMLAPGEAHGSSQTTNTLATSNPVAPDRLSSETLANPKDVQLAYDTLQKATVFPISGYIGFAAQTPPEIVAFQLIIKSRYADSLFKRLLLQKNITPRLIGLCGVFYTDPTAFIREGKRIKEKGETLRVMDGCMVFDVPARDLIGPIELVTIDVKGKIKPAPVASQKSATLMDQSIATAQLPLLFKGFDRNAAAGASTSKATK